MCKLGTAKEKRRNLAILVPMLPGNKVQWLDNHVADMLDAICSDHDFFARISWSFNQCAFGEHFATHTAALSAFSFSSLLIMFLEIKVRLVTYGSTVAFLPHF